LFPIPNLSSQTTYVTCTGSDAAGNTDDDSFNVIVEDITEPLIFIPTNVDHDVVTLNPQPGGITNLANSTTNIPSAIDSITGLESFLMEATKTSGTDVNYTATAFDVVGVSDATFSCTTPGDAVPAQNAPDLPLLTALVPNS